MCGIYPDEINRKTGVALHYRAMKEKEEEEEEDSSVLVLLSARLVRTNRCSG